MLSKTIEDFLEAIYNIFSKKGYVKNKDIAIELHVKAPSATATLKKLKDDEMITYEKYENVLLTEKGKKIAISVKNTHENIKKFLLLLSIPNEISQKDACEIEHDLSEETKERMFLFVKFLEQNNDFLERFKNFCEYTAKNSTNKLLIEMNENERGKIVGFCDECEKGIKALENIGVRRGKEFIVIAKQPYGPLAIKIDKQEIAIGRGKAEKIYVEKL